MSRKYTHDGQSLELPNAAALIAALGPEGLNHCSVELEEVTNSIRDSRFLDFNLRRCQVQDITVLNCHWSECLFRESTLKRTQWVNSTLLNVTYRHCHMSEGRFRNCALGGVLFNRSQLTSTVFFHCDMSRLTPYNTTFDMAEMVDVGFSQCDLGHNSFHRSDLAHASFKSCRLANAEFVDCDLRWTVFLDCEMPSIRFERCLINSETKLGPEVDVPRLLAHRRLIWECSKPFNPELYTRTNPRRHVLM